MMSENRLTLKNFSVHLAVSGKGSDKRASNAVSECGQLFELSAKIDPGQILTVMGPSGVGKSTLINAIAGLLPSQFELRGEILLGGHSLIGMPVERRRLGVLFQDPLLFPHFSVGQNVAYGLPAKFKGTERRARINELLESVDLAGFESRDPNALSGGQKSRVALVRMLAAEPCALLLDEPFSKLDMQLRDSVRTATFEEARRRNLPTVLVTHDEADAAAANGKILRLKASE